MLASLKGATGDIRRILSLVRNAEQCHSGRELCLVYSAAIDAYNSPKAPQDEAYRELCVKYMLELCQVDVNEAREFHNRQRAFGVTSDSRMYVARASLEAREGDEKKAMKILQEGIRAGAQPVGLLKQHMEELQKQEEATPIDVPKEDCAIQTERPAGRNSSTQTEGKKLNKALPLSLANRILQRWERMQRNCCLFDTFGAWKDVRDASVQRRQKALFESLQEQLDVATRKTRAAEVCLKSAGRTPQMAWLLASFRVWRSYVDVCRQRQRLVNVVVQEELRRRAFRVLLAWRTTCSFSQAMPPEATGRSEVPMLESLLIDLQPEQSSRSPLQSIAQQNTRAARADGMDADEPKQNLRGPQRFLYDTSSYTGCTRYGGPMTVDKKENVGRLTRPKLKHEGIFAERDGNSCPK